MIMMMVMTISSTVRKAAHATSIISIELENMFVPLSLLLPVCAAAVSGCSTTVTTEFTCYVDLVYRVKFTHISYLNTCSSR